MVILLLSYHNMVSIADLRCGHTYEKNFDTILELSQYTGCLDKP